MTPKTKNIHAEPHKKRNKTEKKPDTKEHATTLKKTNKKEKKKSKTQKNKNNANTHKKA